MINVLRSSASYKRATGRGLAGLLIMALVLFTAGAFHLQLHKLGPERGCQMCHTGSVVMEGPAITTMAPSLPPEELLGKRASQFAIPRPPISAAATRAPPR